MTCVGGGGGGGGGDVGLFVCVLVGIKLSTFKSINIHV